MNFDGGRRFASLRFLKDYSDMIKNVFIDLDDTLLDFRRAEREALSRTLVHFGYTPTDEILNRYNEINESFWRRLETGELDRPTLKRERYRQLAAEYNLKLAPEELNLQYESELSIGHYFLDGAEQLINDLKREGYRLYLATNGSANIQHGRIASAGLDKIFDGVFISQEVGSYKPDIRYFEACFERIADFKKSETVMVGDSLTSDMRGGINAGIATAWYNPEHKENTTEIKPDYEFSHLCDLIELLKKI